MGRGRWSRTRPEFAPQFSDTDIVRLREALGAELEQAVERRKTFLTRPVSAPIDIELDADLVGAVGNLTVGKNPFGLKGLFGFSQQRRQIDGIRVLVNRPADTDTWKYV